MSDIIVSPRAPVVVTVTGTSSPSSSVSDIVVAPGQGGARGVPGPPGPLETLAVFTRQNEISPVVGLGRLYMEGTRVLSKIRASLGIPCVGSDVVVAVYLNGVSLGSIHITPGSYTTLLSLARTVNAGDYLTASILSVGSVYSGSDLTITLEIN